MHAVPPSPTFTLWTGLLAAEVVTKALAQGMPDAVPARSGGDVFDVMGVGIHPSTGQMWLEATNEGVGFGGSTGGDGENGIMHLSEPGCRNNPVEILETKAPWLIENYKLRPDSGGAGQHRGGLGITRTYLPRSLPSSRRRRSCCERALARSQPLTTSIGRSASWLRYSRSSSERITSER